MTLRHELWKYVHQKDIIRECVNCRRVSYDDSWIDYDVPVQLRWKVTGSACPECLKSFFPDKVSFVPRDLK